MAGLIDSYKKVYENKKMHIWIFLIAFVWSLLSNLCDIAIGKPDSVRQNPFDLVFNFFVGIYSIQFLHNAIMSDSSLPAFKEINWKALPGLIGLNIVWGFYMVLVLIAAVISYFVIHSIVLPIIVLGVILLLSVFVYYIYLAYAEDFNINGLLDIRLIINFIKVSAKETYIKLGLFVLFSLAVVAVYLIIYVLSAFTGIDKFCHIAGDYYLFDMIMYAVIGYFLIVTWFFAFPYSLIKTYIEKIRPVLNKEIVNV